MVWRFLKFWISWTGDIKWCCKSKFRQFRVGFSMCRSHQGSAACSKVRWPILTKYLPDFFKGTLKGHSMFGHRYFMLNLTCWVLQPEHLCRFHPFTTCDRFESLPGRLSRDLGSAALRFAQKLLCWTVTFHRVNCFFLNHVKVLLGCLYVSYKHILASWSINTTFHRFSL